jgi:hypothetical protein
MGGGAAAGASLHGPPFFLAGKSMGTGGAMAEEQEEGGCTQGSERSGLISGPKTGLVLRPVPVMADEAVRGDFKGFVECFLYNILERKHMPSAKEILQLASFLEQPGPLSEEVVTSFAESLVKASLELQELEDEE